MRTRNEMRRIRQERIRKHISGTATCPRLSIYRSNANIFVQVIDDVEGKTICATSTIALKLEHANIEAAKTLGTEIAKLAMAKGITKIIFDRSGNRYFGRIQELADAARAAGLKF